jgi:peptidoglycan-associated lipoprotein
MGLSVKSTRKIAKILDKLTTNLEDRETVSSGFEERMKSFASNGRAQRRLLSFYLLVVLPILFSACSSSESKPGQTLSPPPFDNSRDTASTRSPSAMEALSRGVAAITPPGAALKDIYFQFDSTDLLSDAQEVLEKNAEWMKANPAARVEIEGHCDDLGSEEYNLALGAKRAEVAKDFLVKEGISADRLVTISYGKEAPACFELTEECRVKNRRARFVIFTDVPTS